MNIRSSGTQDDSIFVIEGVAYFSNRERDMQAMASGQIDSQPVLFEGKIEITTDSHAMVCHVDTALIDEYLSLKNISDSSPESSVNASIERLMFLKSTRAFHDLPVNIVEEAAKRCEEISVNKGDLVVKQDTRADTFYILLEGQAEVWREALEEDEPKMIALLDQGDTFGEEALITGGARNASIKMTSDGRMLKLSKEDFDQLVSAPALRAVTPEVAKTMADNGVEIIDVRFEEEYDKSFIPGSVLIPLPDLPNHIDSLDKDKEYLILCAVGLRSAAATLILRQQGIKAILIEGGIKAWPFDTAKTMDLELIMFDFCPFAQRGAISLQHNKIAHRLTYLDPDNLPDWFDEVSPFGKVPILRVDGKTTIFESSVINELIGSLSSKKMLPADPVERGLCRSWIEFGSTMLGQLTGMISAADESAYVATHDCFLENLQRLEAQMKNRGPLFSGELFTLVDSTYAPLFMRMDYLNQRMNLYQVADYPKVTTWAKELRKMESVKDSVPSPFEGIYQQFIQRRGSHGYLLNELGVQ